MAKFTVDYMTGMNAHSTDSGSDVGSCRTPSPAETTDSESSGDNAEAADNKKSEHALAKSGNRHEEKPSHSYITLISMAILSDPDKKMLLGDIYQYIMDNFPYYNNRSRAWRNSIRHNLSLNECFVKNGRAGNGNGNFWSIHSACVEDFTKGDFRRRQARRRARRNTKEISVSELPMSYRCNLGYVPMSSIPSAYHPYAPFPFSYTPPLAGSLHSLPQTLYGSMCPTSASPASGNGNFPASASIMPYSSS